MDEFLVLNATQNRYEKFLYLFWVAFSLDNDKRGKKDVIGLFRKQLSLNLKLQLSAGHKYVIRAATAGKAPKA